MMRCARARLKRQEMRVTKRVSIVGEDNNRCKDDYRVLFRCSGLPLGPTERNTTH